MLFSNLTNSLVRQIYSKADDAVGDAFFPQVKNLLDCVGTLAQWLGVPHLGHFFCQGVQVFDHEALLLLERRVVRLGVAMAA